MGFDKVLHSDKVVEMTKFYAQKVPDQQHLLTGRLNRAITQKR